MSNFSSKSFYLFFFIFSLTFIPTLQKFPKNRYPEMILNISALTQTSTGLSEKIQLSSKHNYFNMMVKNIRLISPVLSKINFTYPYPDFFSVIQASNIIFTFVSNIEVDINDYISEGKKYSFILDDFLFQLTYPFIVFNIDYKMHMNIGTFSQPILFYSNAHTIGTLKSFSFFNEDKENKQELTNFFDEIIRNKYYSLLNSTNLIEYDTILLFSYMEHYYNKTAITDSSLNVTNLTVKSHKYSSLKKDIQNQTLIIYLLEIEMNIGTKNNEYLDLEYSINNFKINNCELDFNTDEIKYAPSDYKDAKNLFKYYEKTFRDYHYQYFNETICFPNDTNSNII